MCVEACICVCVHTCMYGFVCFKFLFNPLYTELTLPYYILEESNFNLGMSGHEIYIFLEKNG